MLCYRVTRFIIVTFDTETPSVELKELVEAVKEAKLNKIIDREAYAYHYT